MEQSFLWGKDRTIACGGFIVLVHWYDWYDWYEWNISHSIGTPLVNCISLWGLRLILWAHRAERGFILLIDTNGISFILLVLHWWIAYHYGDLEYFCGCMGLRGGSFYSSIGTIGTIGTNGISFIPLVLHLWIAYHYGDLEYFCGCNGLRGGSFYSSIGMIGTTGTNGISFIPLVLHWWIACHYGDFEYFRGGIRLGGVAFFFPLVRLVRLLSIYNHSFYWYFIGEIQSLQGVWKFSLAPVVGWKFHSCIGMIGINGISFMRLVREDTYCSCYGWFISIFQMWWRCTL